MHLCYCHQHTELTAVVTWVCVTANSRLSYNSCCYMHLYYCQQHTELTAVVTWVCVTANSTLS
jgi:hypothetical protein